MEKKPVEMRMFPDYKAPAPVVEEVKAPVEAPVEEVEVKAKKKAKE
jgi:hypothetical protein